jgi:hypothetical protein
MKLPTKKKYFDKIKHGTKDFELRDAHITFVCEETGETLVREIESACVCRREAFAEGFDVLQDDFVLFMKLGRRREHVQ